MLGSKHGEPRLLFFAGSAREKSFNKRLARLGASIADANGIAATFADLADYPMPIYDGDLEARSGQPENAHKLKALMSVHTGIFIASPEYNSSFSPLLKNTIDWVSHVREEGEPAMQVYKTRVFALGSASPGGMGGLRGLSHLRLVLEVGIGALVLPDQFAVPRAGGRVRGERAPEEQGQPGAAQAPDSEARARGAHSARRRGDGVRYEQCATEARDKLIVALDVPTYDNARDLIIELGDAVAFYKIGLELLFADGLAFARELANEGKRVFLDLKLLDIGNTVERAVANAAAIGVDFLTIHGHDSKTLGAARKGRGDAQLKLLAVTVLTNLDARDLSEQGLDHDAARARCEARAPCARRLASTA